MRYFLASAITAAFAVILLASQVQAEELKRKGCCQQGKVCYCVARAKKTLKGVAQPEMLLTWEQAQKVEQFISKNKKIAPKTDMLFTDEQAKMVEQFTSENKKILEKAGKKMNQCTLPCCQCPPAVSGNWCCN